MALNLTKQDYEAIGNCLSPEQRSYAIRLTYNPQNTPCSHNDTHPYFWGRNETSCVNGKPLTLPDEFAEPERCHLAVIMPGSTKNIFKASWGRCNVTWSYICQTQENSVRLPRCENVALSPTTSSSNTSVIIGSLFGVSSFFILLLLCYLFYNRKKKQNASSRASTQEVIFKYV